MNNFLKLLLSLVFSFHALFAPHLASAGDKKSDRLNLLEDIEVSGTAEYQYRTSNLDRLISVQLLGAVQRPGLYYIPAQTPLLKLLTLAGGFSNETAEDEILLRRSQGPKLSELDLEFAELKGKAYEINIEKLLKNGSTSSVNLAQDDVIYIPKKEPLISNDTYRTVTVISVVLTAVLTGLLIDDRVAR